MRTAITLSFVLLPALLATDRGREFRISQTTYVAANALDLWSSRGKIELNPLLRDAGGRCCGWKAIVVKSGIVGGYLLGSSWLARRHLVWRKGFTIANWAAAGFVGGIAVSNQIRSKRR